MATTRQLLQSLASGTVTLEQVVANFQIRDWPRPQRLTDLDVAGVADMPLVDDDSVDWIEINPGLTSQQRAALRAAYDQAVHRP